MTPKDESDLRAALEPCPHCGVPLFIRDSVNAYGRCETEGCWMYERKLTVQLDDPRQIEQWNTRATPPSDHIASPSGDMVLIERARLQRLADRLNAAGVIRISNSGAVHEIAAMLQDATPSPAQQSGEAKKDYRLNLAKALFEATYDGNLQIWSDATRDYWLGRADTAIASHGAQQSGELREADRRRLSMARGQLTSALNLRGAGVPAGRWGWAMDHGVWLLGLAEEALASTTPPQSRETVRAEMIEECAKARNELAGYVARRRKWSSEMSMMSIPQPVIERVIQALASTEAPVSGEGM